VAAETETGTQAETEAKTGPKTEAKAEAEPKAKAEGKGKGKGEDKGKGKPAAKSAKSGKSPAAKGAAGAAGADGPNLSLAAHPRAVRRIAEAKAWGGLLGFLLGGYLSLPTHSVLEAALRALLAGVVCYVFVWGAAVFLWRRLVVAELRHAEQALLTTRLAKLQASDPTAAPASAPAIERGRAGAIS
jgi:hypothetical protein